MSVGKMILFVDSDGDARYVKLKVSKKSQTFHQREFVDPESMIEAVSAWFAAKKAKKVFMKERAMTAEELLMEQLEASFIFNEIIGALAAEAEGLEKWDDFDTELLADIATIGPVHISYVQGMFDNIRAAFTPTVFCELAATEDRPETFTSGPTFLTPMNDGMNRIRDVVYGNTKADRMVTIDFRQIGTKTE